MLLSIVCIFGFALSFIAVSDLALVSLDFTFTLTALIKNTDRS